MPTTLYEDIRGALQPLADSVSGFPPIAQRSFEGMLFTSTTGVPWARITLMPVSGRPMTVSTNRKKHVGLFLIDLYGNPQIGSGGVEAVADAVMTIYKPPLRLMITGATDTVGIDYSERKSARPDGQYTMIPITVGWHCFSERN